MNQSSKKPGRKSRAKNQKKDTERQIDVIQMSLLKENLISNLQESVHAFAVEMGLLVARELIEDEVQQICGERYTHQVDRQANRHGSQSGSICISGQKISIRKPRVRSKDGELPLSTYELLNQPDAMPEAVLRRLVRGVSCRDYDDVIDLAADGFGVDRSSVSRSFKTASKAQLRKLLERRFDGERFVCIYIDGTDYADEMMIAAMGVKPDGIKEILSLRQGATENTAVCTDLLTDLQERGLRTDQPVLFVIDGSKALRKAIKSVFGRFAVIQRCQVHKRKNIKGYVSEEMWSDVSRRLSDAYNETDYDKALKKLQNLADWLDRCGNPYASASVREGMEETLTVVRLGVHSKLRRTVATTNPIESAFSVTNTVTKRVKRWREGDMRLRWFASGLLRAESKFRKVNGYKYFYQLEKALEYEVMKKAGAKLDTTNKVA